MKASSVRTWSLVLALACPVGAEAEQFVLVLRPGGASWQVQEAERIAFNDKDKLRTGSAQRSEVRGDEYKKLPPQPISRAGGFRRHAAGYFVARNGAGWGPVLPDGASVKGSISYAELWSSAKITIQKSRDKKSTAGIRPADLFAVIPGTDRDEALGSFLSGEENFKGLGERDPSAAFEEWKSALVALGPTVKGQSGLKIQQKLLSEMQSALQKIRTGLAHNSDLEFGLQYAAVSKLAYPQEESQKKAREALEGMRSQLDLRIAILRAFNAAGLWDAFLDKYGDFSRWDNSFDDVKKVQEKAFIESANEHRDRGMRLEKEGRYKPALKEMQIAQQRLPNDQAITNWVERLRIKDAQIQGEKRKKTVDVNSPEQIELRAFLGTADRFMEEKEKQCDDAESEINKAVNLDNESPAIVFSRAKLARCREELLKALETLNEYDQRITDKDDMKQSQTLRTNINYDLQKAKKTYRNDIIQARADGDYLRAAEIAEKGLALDGNDLEFLQQAGMCRAILRKNLEAEQVLNTYLRLSQGPSSDPKKRQQVYDLLPKVKETIPEPQGTPNWFSGYKSPPGVFYCPISLMPNARPGEVKASRKQTTSFEWSRDALNAVRTTSLLPNDAAFTGYFEYFPDGKSVRRVSAEAISEGKQSSAQLRFTTNPVAVGKGAYTVLLNNPTVDPFMIEKLTGARVGAIIAGNPYFHPFVWQGVYLFIAEYDNQGRVKSARQVLRADPKEGTKEDLHDFDFQWEGSRLLAIVERGTGNYRRSMTYSGGKLTAETVSYRGKDSKIEYKYKGDVLVEASTGEDWSLDGRSRHVTFR